MRQFPAFDSASFNSHYPDFDVQDGFSAYVHIPFCKVRCGYCDFNTYTNLDFGSGVSINDYAETLIREITLSEKVLSRFRKPGPLRSIFFGGGTPTLLSARYLVQILNALRNAFGFISDIEITTEANPETVSLKQLEILQAAGLNRVSFGMQSAVPHVLHTLDRLHTPGQIELAVSMAHELGLNFSLDLIYGTPGESDSDWEKTLQTAIALKPNHISCYALTIEQGTRMGRSLATGQINAPDDDILARRYEQANEVLEDAGYHWYEISNWAQPGFECRHNLFYWRNANWWGYGPGAHSHLNGIRFWNVKHPLAYAGRLNSTASANPMLPILENEKLSPIERLEETIMLGIRLREGIPVLPQIKQSTIQRLIDDALIDRQSVLENKRLILTLQGRLLADSVVRELWMDL